MNPYYSVRSGLTGRPIGAPWRRAKDAQTQATRLSTVKPYTIEVMGLDDMGEPNTAMGYAYRGQWTPSEA